jgi:hypothetical protein
VVLLGRRHRRPRDRQDDPTLNLQQRHGRRDVYPAPATTFQTAFTACSVRGSDPGGRRAAHLRSEAGRPRRCLGDGFAIEVGLGFGPDLQADQLAGLAGLEVAVFEVDAAVLAGDAGLVGGRGEGLPRQGSQGWRDRAQLHAGAAVPDLSW